MLKKLLCVVLPIVLCAPSAARETLSGPFQVEILKVIDGDTFVARISIWLRQSVTTKVRLRGIDTPELRGKCAAEKELAKRAKQFATDWLAKNEIVLKNVSYGTYAGRIIATTQAKGAAQNLEQALLSVKLAQPYQGRRKRAKNWCS